MKSVLASVLFRSTLVIVGFVGGIMKDRIEETAFEIDCPGFTFTASPADRHLTLERAQTIAECMGNNASHICTLTVVKMRRSK